MEIFIRNLSRSVTETELRETFEKFGNVASVTLVREQLTRQPVGFAFVNMPHDAQALSAINALRNVDLKGRTIVFNETGRRFERRHSIERRRNARTQTDRRRVRGTH